MKEAKEFLESADKMLMKEIVWPKHIYKTNFSVLETDTYNDSLLSENQIYNTF